MVVESGEITPNVKATLQAQLDGLVEQYNTRFAELLSENQRRLFVRGIKLVDTLLEGGNVTAALPYLSDSLLRELQTFGAELVTNLTRDARRQVARELTLGALGQKPMVDVVRDIGRNLRSRSIFRSIDQRATVIFQTETHRIYNMAAAERLRQAAKQIPGLGKKWVYSHRTAPRLGHLALDNVVVPATGRFKLIGKKPKRIYLVDAPHDPILPPGETVNCMCSITPVVPPPKARRSTNF